MNDNDMIDTPLGPKRWGFVRKAIESHEELLQACKQVIEDLCNFKQIKIPAGTFAKLNAAISKAEGR